VESRESGSIAEAIDRDIGALEERSTQAIRQVRRAYSKRLKGAAPEEALAVALALVERGALRARWVAYELVYHHPQGFDGIGIDEVEALGRGLDGWGAVDAFARYISGPAWRLGKIADADIQRWARSEDRHWRRTALVSTVPLNLRAAGGTGDARRTLDICAMLVTDRDDTVVKALSWALRELVFWDPEAVRAFIERHHDTLAARVKREVRGKLETGKKP
jgi:3-methyladenine DNA glycosylase AlkD